MAHSVEEYLKKHSDWEPRLSQLRDLLLSSGLEETVKWGAPAYTLNGKNVVGIAAFKNHCALWFHQGTLLKEHTSLLHDPGKDGPKAMLQIRFGNGQKINPNLLRGYVLEAAQNQIEGKIIKPAKGKALEMPAELLTAVDEDETLKQKFENLTPGRQREYADHIAEAKWEATKLKA